MNSRQLLIGALLVLSAQAGASTTYVYTGNPYTSIDDDVQLFGGPVTDDILPGTYDTSMSVTGSVELENALGANLFDFNVLHTALNFSFFDGRNTINKQTNESQSTSTVMYFSTDAQGTIVRWLIQLIDGDPQLQNTGRNLILSGFLTNNVVSRDTGEIDLSFVPAGSTSDRGRSFVSGVWSVQVAPVPVPPSLWLLGPTIVGLGIARRRTA